MDELLNGLTTARRLGEHAKKVARERFGLDRFTRDWNAAFTRVTSSPLPHMVATNGTEIGTR